MQNTVIHVAIMGKICKQAVTHIYQRKYYQSFRRLLVKFRENMTGFKSIQVQFSRNFILVATRGFTPPLAGFYLLGRVPPPPLAKDFFIPLNPEKSPWQAPSPPYFHFAPLPNVTSSPLNNNFHHVITQYKRHFQLQSLLLYHLYSNSILFVHTSYASFDF